MRLGKIGFATAMDMTLGDNGFREPKKRIGTSTGKSENRWRDHYRAPRSMSAEHQAYFDKYKTLDGFYNKKKILKTVAV